MITVDLDEGEMAVAWDLARARQTDVQRQRSPTRASSANAPAQLRGAVGEIAAAKWLEGEGRDVVRGYETDEEGDPDLEVDGVGFEVMTAQIVHRERTGFCVPPNKLWAHQRRGVRGYVFVGTGPERSPTSVEIQAVCRIEDVDTNDTEWTSVRDGGTPVENYVVPADSLMPPEAIGLLIED